MTLFPPDVIYIGLQKTGSTYLRNYFYNHPEIHCSRFGTFFQTEAADIATQGTEAVRARYEAFFCEDPAKPCRIDMYEAIGMGYVLRGLDAWSAEHFVKVGALLNRGHVFTAPEIIASRVKAARPEARILITIRNQASWLDSNYRHFFEQLPEGRESLFDFLSTPEGKVVLDAAMFDRVVGIYDALFGPERVFVLPMERIEQAEELALRELCGFLGVQPVPYKAEHKNQNKGRPIGALMSARIQEGEDSSSLLDRLLGKAKPQWKIATDEALKYLACAYAASNARLSERTGLDLASLGYVC
jgi:hypothetical protein